MIKRTILTIIIIFAIFLSGRSISFVAAEDISSASKNQKAVTLINDHGAKFSIMVVGLSDREVEDLEENLATFKETITDVKKEICKISQELQQELLENDPDLEIAKEYQGEISKLKAKLDLLRLEHMVEMKKIAPHVLKDTVPANRHDLPQNNNNEYVYDI